MDLVVQVDLAVDLRLLYLQLYPLLFLQLLLQLFLQFLHLVLQTHVALDGIAMEMR